MVDARTLVHTKNKKNKKKKKRAFFSCNLIKIEAAAAHRAVPKPARWRLSNLYGKTLSTKSTRSTVYLG
jgi:hypothetical protein